MVRPGENSSQNRGREKLERSCSPGRAFYGQENARRCLTPEGCRVCSEKLEVDVLASGYRGRRCGGITSGPVRLSAEVVDRPLRENMYLPQEESGRCKTCAHNTATEYCGRPLAADRLQLDLPHDLSGPPLLDTVGRAISVAFYSAHTFEIAGTTTKRDDMVVPAVFFSTPTTCVAICLLGLPGCPSSTCLVDARLS